MVVASDIDAALESFEQGCYEQSVQVCRTILLKTPNSFNTSQILALSLSRLGSLKEALVIFEGLAKLNTKHAATFNNIGNIYLDWQDFVKASEYFETALSLEPNMAEAYNNLGLCLAQFKDFSGAELHFRKAISINEQTADFHKNLGELLSDGGRFYDAIDCFLNVLKLDDRYTSSYWRVFIIQLYLHRYQDALDVVELAVMSETLSEPELCELLVGKAIIFWVNGNASAAAQAIKLSEKIYSYSHYSSNMATMIIFHRYIKNILINTEKCAAIYQPKTNTAKPLYFIAESHCLSFNNVVVDINDEEYQVQSLPILGCKIHHLINDMDNKYKESITLLFENIAPKSKIVMGFGEIDCRYNEGILPYCLKSKKSYKDVINSMLTRYVDMLCSIAEQCDIEIIIYGVPSPYIALVENLEPENQVLFKDMVLYFNRILQSNCQAAAMTYLDVYGLTNKHGVSNLLYHIDSNHLSPIAITKLLK